ncbi:hypothetical protein CJD36_021220 [Flavipsychrobacter stenotrophus]|uniref:DUF6671 domain-containing protein n=1 Tax=Flavipsychrobacter stenotrophus TaxID=2077091 RepID=A0A2S7SR52_9BACT|nr:DUF6671 family protein [Flavipsychrobacter stenotrophus]PQJ09097.1 hypothetical protein CJD36_021220 [Flavipsychrobacter stenotrophus]
MNDKIRQYFAGRKLVIATMHGKEATIGPILTRELGVEIVVPEHFNTDTYGTFSGEIERIVDPVEAGRIKCIAACELTGCDLAIASEGSFGPHPTMFFAAADDEILVFVDLKNKLEIKARVISRDTNFAGDLFTDWPETKKFAEASSFPSHSLIVRKSKNGNEDIVKGISSWDSLQDTFEVFFRKYGAVFVETDMRAMHNPTRQRVIHEATTKLVKTIHNICPNCSLPGFDVKTVRVGLPCKMCGSPTRSTYSFVYECQKCEHRAEIKYPNGQEYEDPMYCDYCNP